MWAWCAANGYAVAQEYIEPGGVSATDDRRPVFQQMIRKVTLSPSPFEAVIVRLKPK
jgi:site-specific DNA recombinase